MPHLHAPIAEACRSTRCRQSLRSCAVFALLALAQLIDPVSSVGPLKAVPAEFMKSLRSGAPLRDSRGSLPPLPAGVLTGAGASFRSCGADDPCYPLSGRGARVRLSSNGIVHEYSDGMKMLRFYSGSISYKNHPQLLAPRVLCIFDHPHPHILSHPASTYRQPRPRAPAVSPARINSLARAHQQLRPHSHPHPHLHPSLPQVLRALYAVDPHSFFQTCYKAGAGTLAAIEPWRVPYGEYIPGSLTCSLPERVLVLRRSGVLLSSSPAHYCQISPCLTN